MRACVCLSVCVCTSSLWGYVFWLWFGKYVRWIESERQPWYKKDLLKMTAYNVWQTAYGLICWNSFSPNMYTVHRDWGRGAVAPKTIMNETDFLIRLLVIRESPVWVRCSQTELVLSSSPRPLRNFFWRKALGFCRSGPSFCAEVVHLYLLLSGVWWQRLFHWNVKTRDRTGSCVCVCACRRSWRRACLAELASTPGLASRLYHMVTFIMYLAIH